MKDRPLFFELYLVFQKKRYLCSTLEKQIFSIVKVLKWFVREDKPLFLCPNAKNIGKKPYFCLSFLFIGYSI